MTPDRPPGLRRMGRAAVAVIVILAAIVIAIFVGRTIWHASEADAPPPETRPSDPRQAP